MILSSSRLVPALAATVIAFSAFALAVSRADGAIEPVRWQAARAQDRAVVLVDSRRLPLRVQANVRGPARGASARALITISIPDRASGTMRTRWVLQARDPAVAGGKPFDLAVGVTTVRYTRLARGYEERIWSRQFDRYWNVCVNGARRVYASGGDVYCVVWHPSRVRVSTRSVVRQLPAPRILSSVDLGPADPDCTVGAISADRYSDGQLLSECRDHVSPRADGGMRIIRRYRTTVRVPRAGGGWRVLRGIGRDLSMGQRGPGWVEIGGQCLHGGVAYAYGQERSEPKSQEDVIHRCSEEQGFPRWDVARSVPLAEPTVTVQSLAQVPPSYPGSSWYAISGTLTSHYRGTCSIAIDMQTTTGTRRSVAFLAAVPAGATVAWSTSSALFNTATDGAPLAQASARVVTCT